jgi:hypothetical protein
MLYPRWVAFVVVSVLSFALSAHAQAQAPQLIFTTPSPNPSSSTNVVEASAVVEERGLALWGGATSDVGVGVMVSTPRWMVRSVRGMTDLSIDGRSRPTFAQVEIARPLWSRGSTTVAAGGGLRQEWDRAPVLIGRVIAGSDVAGGRLQGSLVLERAGPSPIAHDTADLVTTVGWSRRIRDGISVGAEGIGQDLEGFWNPKEADGGAKLLVGPSLQARSANGAWAAGVTVGAVFHSVSGASHVGFFASASWIPSIRHNITGSPSGTRIIHAGKEQP